MAGLLCRCAGRSLQLVRRRHRGTKAQKASCYFGVCSVVSTESLLEGIVDTMSLEQKIALLMSLAGDDREANPSVPGFAPPRLRHANDAGALRPLNFRTVSAGRGRRTTLLRILMTNACSFNCHYCPMRRDRNMPRALLKPHELVASFSRHDIAAGVKDCSSRRRSPGGR